MKLFILAYYSDEITVAQERGTGKLLPNKIVFKSRKAAEDFAKAEGHDDFGYEIAEFNTDDLEG